MKEFLNVFLNQFFTKPEIILAVVVMFGYMFLRRPASKVISGVIKTAVGIMILQAGSSYLMTNFKPVLDILTGSLGMKGYIIDPYAGLSAATTALGEMAVLVGYTMITAFILNLLYVRIFKFRAVFLTGHIMLQQATVLTWMIYYIFGLSGVPTVIIASILLSIYWTVFSHLLVRPTAVVTTGNINATADEAGFSIGHQQMAADLLAFKFGGKIGNPEDSVEKINLPSWLSIFQDNVVATSIVMTLFTSVFLLFAGVDAIQAQAGATHWLLYMLYMGLRVAVSISIILTGVRMFIAELVPAFKGIADKVLPGTVAAIDVPAVFPFAPKAVILGFICTVIGQVIGLTILGIVGTSIAIIPGFVPLFFDGGPVGVFANASGGWKATVVFTTLLGMVHILGASLVIPMTGLVGGWLGNFDWSTVWGAVFYVLHLIAGALGLGL